MLIITTPEIVIAQAIVDKARKMNPSIQVVARAPGIEFLEEFKKLKISEVVIPEFEAGLEMARKALEYLHIPAAKIQHYSESLRQDLFASFYSENEEYKILEKLKLAEHQYDIQWVLLKEDSFFNGKTIMELKLNAELDCSVAGVVRDETLYPNPDHHFRFQANDRVAIIGTDSAREKFTQLALPVSRIVKES